MSNSDKPSTPEKSMPNSPRESAEVRGNRVREIMRENLRRASEQAEREAAAKKAK